MMDSKSHSLGLVFVTGQDGDRVAAHPDRNVRKKTKKKPRLFHQSIRFSSSRNFKRWTIQPYIYLFFQSFQALSIHPAAAHLHNHTLFPPETSASSSGSEQPWGSHTKSLRVKRNGRILKRRRISATGGELCCETKYFNFFCDITMKRSCSFLQLVEPVTREYLQLMQK